MINIEKTISNLVKSHFPFFMQEDAPVFIEFVKKYYEWLEQEGNTLYHSRNIPVYKDIDSTTDQFLVYFKEKYLKNIQFNTEISTKRMVKHSLDLYRSKGTERAIDLLFKSVFNTPAQVYLPGDDLFKLSSGDYYQKLYLEVTPNPMNIMFVGKQIIGVQSKTTAFVEKLVRKKIKEVYSEVFTISDINPKGLHFQTGETIKTADQTEIKNNPKITGSLTNLRVEDSGYGFSVGDQVNIESDLGVGAVGRVANTADVTGKVTFTLEDGGFGFSSNASIYVSNSVLLVSNVNVNTSYISTYGSLTSYFKYKDTVISNQCRIAANNIFKNTTPSAANLQIGDKIYVYNTDDTLKGTGTIQYFNITNTTSGVIYLNVLSGNLDCRGVTTINAYFTDSNTISMNLVSVSSYSNTSAVATVLGIDKTITVKYQNSRSFQVNETVYQVDINNIQIASGTVSQVTSSGLYGTLKITDIKGLFDNSKTLYGQKSGASAEVTSIDVNLGIIDTYDVVDVQTTSACNQISVSNTLPIFAGMFISSNNGYVPYATNVASVSVGSPNNTITMTAAATATGLSVLSFKQVNRFDSNTVNYVKVYDSNNYNYSEATLSSVSTGNGASFSIAPFLLNSETININTDFLRDHLSTSLGVYDYGFNPVYVANDTNSTVLKDALNYNIITIGTISGLSGVYSGNNYNVNPVIRVEEPLVSYYKKQNLIINVVNATAGFYLNEIVTQPSTGAKGYVISSNNDAIVVKNYSFENDFASNNQIKGKYSGATAIVSNIRKDEYSLSMGLNAIITGNVVSRQGGVTDIQVIDSGYGYAHDELATFYSTDGTRFGLARALLGSRTSNTDSRGVEGKSIGVYRDNNGFLSDYKKLQDGYYYQEFSYEVRSSVTLDKYEAMLKQLLHVAGTKYFAATIKSSDIPVQPTINTLAIDKYNVTIDRTDITGDSTIYTADVTYKEG
jgi:hypothetical protein